MRPFRVTGPIRRFTTWFPLHDGSFVTNQVLYGADVLDWNVKRSRTAQGANRRALQGGLAGRDVHARKKRALALYRDGD